MPKQPRRPTSYQYKPGDNLSNLSNQYGVTEQQILQANPGGFPFSTGQVISIPSHLPGLNATSNLQNQPLQPAAQGYGLGPPRMTQPYAYAASPAGTLPTLNPAAFAGGLASPYQQQTDAAVYQQSQTHPNPGLANRGNTGVPVTGFRGPAPMDAGLQAAANGGVLPSKTGNSDFMNTKFMQEYAANGTPLERQLRWDPKTKKYITVGRWLKLQDRDRRRDHIARSRQRKEQQAAQAAVRNDSATVSNTFINFNASSG